MTDDTSARLAARSMEISVHGTIGILLRSIRRNQRTKVEVVLALRSLPSSSTLHIKRTLLEEILRTVEDHQ